MEPATPNLVIVGRPNVGKSSLLNRLARRRVSIVDPTAGVTRDRVSVQVALPAGGGRDGWAVTLTDTGGYGIEDAQGLTRDVADQISQGIRGADLILFVVDAQTGLIPLDHEVARLLRTCGCAAPILVVANKVDGPSNEAAAEEAARLGFGRPIPFSAATGHNQAELLRRVAQGVAESVPQGEGNAPDDQARPAGDGVLLAIAGKRNAGKSTLVNALAGGPRVIVSEVPGTTRDSVDVRFEIDGRSFTAIDTAGVRKRKSVADDVEFYSLHRTLRSVRRADVVLLLIDAAVPVSQVDEQLAGEVLRHHKPCVVVLNKWDLAERKHTQDEYLRYLDGVLKGLSHAPVAFISAQRGEGVRELVETAMDLHRQAGERVSTGLLNRVIEETLARHTPRARGGRPPKVYYATQLDAHPPTIGLFVNDPALFDPAYERFLVNRLRGALPFAEVPIRLMFRGKGEGRQWAASGGRVASAG